MIGKRLACHVCCNRSESVDKMWTRSYRSVFNDGSCVGGQLGGSFPRLVHGARKKEASA